MNLSFLKRNKSNILLISLIISQLFVNIKLITIVKTLKDQGKKTFAQFYEYDGEGELLNPLDHYYNEVRYRSEIFKKPKNKPYLVVVFDDTGCPACVSENVSYINDLYNKYNSNIIVFYQGIKVNYLSSYTPLFSYDVIDPDSNLFTKKIVFTKPSAFLIGENDFVYEIYRAETGVSSKTAIFYKKVKWILDAIFEKN